MQLVGVIKNYNAIRRCGYLAVDGHPDIFFALKDVPVGYIQPRIGEKFEFILYEQAGKRFAGDIVRLEVQAEKTFKAKLKGIRHRALMYFYAQSKTKQQQIVLIIASVGLLIVASIFYFSHQSYQSYKQNKAQALILEQQKLVEKQRAALGELPDQVLSEQGRRNMSGQVYGQVSGRSESNTASIDKQKGRLPVTTGKFKCDGRTQCSEMRSLAEAQYFHKHCRGTKLDGNGNGKPCENDTRWVR